MQGSAMLEIGVKRLDETPRRTKVESQLFAQMITSRYTRLSYVLRHNPPPRRLVPGAVPNIPGRTLSERQARDVGALLSLPSLEPLASHLSTNPEPWCQVLDENEAEKFLPLSGWTTDDVSKERQAFLSVAVVHALRPDRTMAAAAELVERVFAEDGGGAGGHARVQGGLPWDEALDLEASVKEGAGPEAPVLLCSEAGNDASWKVLTKPRRPTRCKCGFTVSLLGLDYDLWGDIDEMK